MRALVSLIALVLAPSLAASFGVGCGVYVSSEDAEQIFFAKHDDALVLMRINGEMATLAVVSEESRGQLRDLGDVMHRVYVQGSTRVEATFTVTRACVAGARECDGVSLSAIFWVRIGDVTQKVSGNGVSGC